MIIKTKEEAKEYYQYLLNNIDKMNWLLIPGFEGYYEESDWGLTKSLERYKQNHSKLQLVEEKILRYKLNNKGYFEVSLWKNNIARFSLVNRLVCETFHGPCPPGLECRHLDNNTLNNHVDNLQWGTRKENQHDRIANGTTARGEQFYHAKLNWEQVNEIRYLYKNKIYNQYELAEKFKVIQPHISQIVNYKQWQY